jgi:hypothetical protein
VITTLFKRATHFHVYYRHHFQEVQDTILISSTSDEKFLLASVVLFLSSSNEHVFPSSLCENDWWTADNIAWVTVVCVIAAVLLIVTYIVFNIIVKRRRDRGQKVWPIFYSISCIKARPPTFGVINHSVPAVVARSAPITNISDVQPPPQSHVAYAPSPYNNAPIAPQIPAYNPSYLAQPMTFDGGDSVMLDPVTGMFVVQPSKMESAPQYDPNSGQWS